MNPFEKLDRYAEHHDLQTTMLPFQIFLVLMKEYCDHRDANCFTDKSVSK